MARIEVYCAAGCMYCTGAKNLLDGKGVDYEEIRIDKVRGKRQEMEQRSGRMTVPQIFIDDRHIGGYDDLSALDRAGDLDPLIG